MTENTANLPLQIRAIHGVSSLNDVQAPFTRSLMASARAISNAATLMVATHGEGEPSLLSRAIARAHPASACPMIEPDKTLHRGCSDAVALITCHHNPDLHKHLLPADDFSRCLFDEMELTRCMALGSHQYAGVAGNLEAFWLQTAAVKIGSRRDAPEQVQLAISSFCHEYLQMTVTRPTHVQELTSKWRGAIVNPTVSIWKKLATAMPDQFVFAQLSLQILESLPGNLNDDLDYLDSVKAQGNTSEEEPGKSPRDPHVDDSDDADQPIGPAEETDLDNAITVDLREESEPGSQPMSVQSSPNEYTSQESANRDAPVDADAENSGAGETGEAAGYRVYSTRHDEIINADTLADASQLDELRRALDTHIERHQSMVGKLSGKLQRVLMAQQQRHWKFDMEEGLLDTSRLNRIVTSSVSALSFKQESDIPFKNTTITLLVDNSKSMLGKPVTIAAACSDLLAQTLERCGVSVEILGFTTTELHSSSQLLHWKNSGSQTYPGRLNGLRHIIYKSADTPYRRSRKSFGAMLLKDLLKQNIDGEALLWAHSRLLRRPEPRKILMVISDGAPIDTSTLSVNQPDLLADHLHYVIADIEKRADVELLAIGIGHDVSGYYHRAITVRDARDLSKTMLSQLATLFTSPQEAARSNSA